jgi:hypothetical protein
VEDLQGGFRDFENAKGPEWEKGIEGKYVRATDESGPSVREVVLIYKDLSDVGRGFRQITDVPANAADLSSDRAASKGTYLRSCPGSAAAAPPGPPAQRAGVDFSVERAMKSLSTARLVTLRLADQAEHRGAGGGRPDARGVIEALKLTELKPPLTQRTTKP